MPSRHRSRQRALQILYQLDVSKLAVSDAFESFYETLYTSELEADEHAQDTPSKDEFMEELVKGTSNRTAEIDQRISAHSAHWRIGRMPAVDRNILRLAIYEMLLENTPAPVVIDEALELARKFAGEESVPFINGVLDAVWREMGGRSSAVAT